MTVSKWVRTVVMVAGLGSMVIAAAAAGSETKGKFYFKKSCKSCHAKGAAGGEVTLGMRRSDGWAQVSVTDTGVGIAPEDLAHIFDRFYRADPSRARSGGFGLGLPIAQWIAQAHGGRIEVESELGHGSTFTLWLPEARAEE